MTHTVVRAMTTIGPRELIPIYTILQQELNRLLVEEKDTIRSLTVMRNGRKVLKGEFTKEFNQKIGNTLYGKVNAWYYRILQLNIYQLLLSLDERKLIQRCLRQNNNQINESLFETLTSLGVYATKGHIKNIQAQKTDVDVPDAKIFELNFGYGDSQIVKQNNHEYQFLIYNQQEAKELEVSQWVSYNMPAFAYAHKGMVKYLKPSFRYYEDMDCMVANLPYEVETKELPEAYTNILGVDLGKVKPYSATALYSDNTYSDEYIPSREVMRLASAIDRKTSHIQSVYEKNKRSMRYNQTDNLTEKQELRYVNSLLTKHKRTRAKRDFAKKIAREIIEIAIHESCKEIHLENLSWLESQGGKWNYSEIQHYIKMFAQIFNIKVITVSCKDSSKKHPFTKEIGVVSGRNIVWSDGSSMDRDKLASLNLALRSKRNAIGKRIPIHKTQTKRIKRTSKKKQNLSLKIDLDLLNKPKDRYQTVYLSTHKEQSMSPLLTLVESKTISNIAKRKQLRRR